MVFAEYSDLHLKMEAIHKTEKLPRRPQDLFPLFAFCEFIHQFVQPAHLLH